MGLSEWIVRLAVKTPHPERFERFLFVGPHADDIEIGAGATAARLAAEGKSVCFVICTDGRHGTADSLDAAGQEALAETRRQEALASARRLGVGDVRFLGFCAGGFYEASALRQALAAVVGDFRPDVIFAPDPFVASESHIDHLAVGEAVRRVACGASNPGIMHALGTEPCPLSALCYYMTAHPNRFVATGRCVKQQFDALFGCFPSQYPADAPESHALRLYLTVRSVDYGLRGLKGRAEGFRVLGATHMHCIPEAGKRA